MSTLQKLHTLRKKYLADLKKIEDRESIGTLRHEYEERVRKLVVSQKNLGLPQSVSDKLTALRERYQLDVEKIISDSDSYRTWDVYVRECVRVIDEFLAQSAQQQDGGQDEVDDEVDDTAPEPRKSRPPSSSRPAIQVIQHDVAESDTVEDDQPPEPLRLQFSADELGHDADDPVPDPTPSPSETTYRKQLENAWR